MTQLRLKPTPPTPKIRLNMNEGSSNRPSSSGQLRIFLSMTHSCEVIFCNSQNFSSKNHVFNLVTRWRTFTWQLQSSLPSDWFKFGRVSWPIKNHSWNLRSPWICKLTANIFLQIISHYRMKLRAFCDILEKIATTRFAAKWDNVGLLVEPADCVGSKMNSSYNRQIRGQWRENFSEGWTFNFKSFPCP